MANPAKMLNVRCVCIFGHSSPWNSVIIGVVIQVGRRNLYRKRGRIEIMFGRFKGWRRLAVRYDRSAHTFFSAICIAAAVVFRL